MAHRLGAHLLRPAIRTPITIISPTATSIISLSSKHPLNPLLKSSFHTLSKPSRSTKLSFHLSSLSPLVSRAYSNKSQASTVASMKYCVLWTGWFKWLHYFISKYFYCYVIIEIAKKLLSWGCPVSCGTRTLWQSTSNTRAGLQEEDQLQRIRVRILLAPLF